LADRGATAGFGEVAFTDVFFGAAGLVLGTFGAAFVDFARVAFFTTSGASTSTSTSSGMTFLGLPLFFTTSEDMVLVGCGAQFAFKD
jgi:hypothetical protein